MSTNNPILLFVLVIACATPPSLAIVGPKSQETLLLEQIQEAYMRNAEQLRMHGLQLWIGAVRSGHTQILQWLLGTHIPGRGFIIRGMNIWHIALSGGHVPVLDWLQHNQIAGRNAATSDRSTWNALAQNDMREVLAWLKRTPELELNFAQQQIVRAAMPFMLEAFTAASALLAANSRH
jgi:hypothetical protein